MLMICCECDWGLGVPMPPHQHVTRSHVRADDGRFDGWIPHFIPQDGYAVLDVVEELSFSVDWKALYRDSDFGGNG